MISLRTHAVIEPLVLESSYGVKLYCDGYMDWNMNLMMMICLKAESALKLGLLQRLDRVSSQDDRCCEECCDDT